MKVAETESTAKEKHLLPVFSSAFARLRQPFIKPDKRHLEQLLY